MAEKASEHIPKQDFNQISTEILIDHLSKITDVEPEIIKACDLPKERLVSIFDRAAHYFSEIAKGHKKLEDLPDNNEVFLPGKYDYGYDAKLHEHAVNAARINAKITGYEQGLTRIATSLVGLATLKAKL